MKNHQEEALDNCNKGLVDEQNQLYSDLKVVGSGRSKILEVVGSITAGC